MADRKQTTTLGSALPVAILAAVAGSFIWIAVPLLAIAALLFAWGLEPARTEALVKRLRSDPTLHTFLARLKLMSSWAAPRLRLMLVVLGIVVGLVPSLPTERLRSGLLVLGIVLGFSGVWILVADLLSPKTSSLPFDRNGAEAAAAHRIRAVMAAEFGAIRGDLWADAAYTGARFMWTSGLPSLDQSESKLLARVRSNAETALALAPINGAAWLFLAMLPDASADAESRVGTLLEMSYFTAPSAPELAPWRLKRAATSSVLADTDIQEFIKSDIRTILSRPPEFQQAIVAAYRSALPQNQPIFESLVADVDSAVAQSLHASQPK